MALLPTIPTSFVPHSTTPSAQRFRSHFTGAFGALAYGALGIVFLMALGVFFYGRLLTAQQVNKDAALAKAEAGIDLTTIESFVRLRNRLTLGDKLLKNHVAFSNFFNLLSTVLPASVRFSSLHITSDSSGLSKIEAAGVAKNFNALAAASAAFADDGRVKDAIFSKISVNFDNSVSFALSASIDPKTIVFSAGDLPTVGVPAATNPSL